MALAVADKTLTPDPAQTVAVPLKHMPVSAEFAYRRTHAPRGNLIYKRSLKSFSCVPSSHQVLPSGLKLKTTLVGNARQAEGASGVKSVFWASSTPRNHGICFVSLLHMIYLSREDKVVFGESLDGVGGELYFHTPPRKRDVGMVPFLLCKGGNFCHEIKCSLEVGEREFF